MRVTTRKEELVSAYYSISTDGPHTGMYGTEIMRTTFRFGRCPLLAFGLHLVAPQYANLLLVLVEGAHHSWLPWFGCSRHLDCILAGAGLLAENNGTRDTEAVLLSRRFLKLWKELHFRMCDRGPPPIHTKMWII
jgi:hypothetical protein